MKFIKGFIIFLCGLLIGGIFMKYSPEYLVQKILDKPDVGLSYYENKYSRFELIDHILGGEYYYSEKLSSTGMIQKAIKAYVDGIDDPYTVYMDVNENSGFLDSLEGEEHFEGIGAIVSKKDYYILVEELIKGAPAYKAGLKPLDRIIKIDDDYVQNETLSEAVSRMRGPVNTSVSVWVERDNNFKDAEIIKIDIIRDVIDIPSVTSKILQVGDKNIGYIEISIIGGETESILKREIATLKQTNLDGIIVDLRGNGGGFLDVAVKVASHFVDKGKLIVSAKYRGYSDSNYYSEGYGDLLGMKTVILIDGLTASAGEIIALALQEQAGATLIGSNSFGKGTIQTMHGFKDGNSLKYTVGAWFPPSEKSINGSGITPDITVEFNSDLYIKDGIDNQLEEAKSLFK